MSTLHHIRRRLGDYDDTWHSEFFDLFFHGSGPYSLQGGALFGEYYGENNSSLNLPNLEGLPRWQSSAYVTSYAQASYVVDASLQ